MKTLAKVLVLASIISAVPAFADQNPSPPCTTASDSTTKDQTSVGAATPANGTKPANTSTSAATAPKSSN